MTSKGTTEIGRAEWTFRFIEGDLDPERWREETDDAIRRGILPPTARNWKPPRSIFREVYKPLVIDTPTHQETP